MESNSLRKGRLVDAIVQGTVQAIILILLLYGLVLLGGNQQQRSLDDIKSSARAQVCVLILPVTDAGRDEGDVNSVCLIPNGLVPIDANQDGIVETSDTQT